jgi:hypothetical protein
MGRGNVQCTATRYRLDKSGFERQWGRDFSTPIQAGPGALPASYTRPTVGFLVVKRPGRDVDHRTPPNSDVKVRVEVKISPPPPSLYAVLEGEHFLPVMQ